GDQIDNIPGVDKVGPKTAAKWIAQYGSLDGVIEHAGDFTGLAGENLRKVLDWLPKARELLTVKRDVPLPFPFERLTEFETKPEIQRSQYERFGFKGLLKELEIAPASEPAAPAPVQAAQKRRTRTLLTEDELREIVLKLEAADIAGFAALGSGDEPMTATLVGLAFAFADEALYLPLAHDYAGAPQQMGLEKALPLLRPWLERGDCRKACENVK